MKLRTEVEDFGEIDFEICLNSTRKMLGEA